MRLADAERFIADQELALEYWEPVLPLTVVCREPVTISLPEFPRVRFGRKPKPEPMVFYDRYEKRIRETVSDPPVKVYRGSRYASKITGKGSGKWKAA